MLVNPSRPIRKVYVFPIHNAVAENKGLYESVRRAWRDININEPLGNDENGVYAVGIVKQKSLITRKIQVWYIDYYENNKSEFAAVPFDNLSSIEKRILNDLLHKDFTRVIRACKGYWQRGNYNAVEFDGKGRFRVIRGAKDKRTWHSCT